MAGTDPKPRVLVVDDNDQKRYTISRYLKASGFEVIETCTGEGALDLAPKEMPTVIALDVNLPDIVGYEVARRLRSDPRTAGIPIVHISATFTTPNSKAHGLNSGADSYLSGPIEPEELIATMNAMIRMRKAEVISRDYAAQWQATFDAISDAVVLVTQDGAVDRCNRAFSTLINKPCEEVVGQNLSDVAGAAAVDQSVYFRMLGSRKRESVERRHENAWYDISADPILDAEGVFKGGVLIISNITDRKLVENARAREQELLQAEAERLEAKVLERTRQLEESMNSMEGFCYTIAHDLRAPLRAVSGLTSELIHQYSSSFGPDGQELGTRITAAAKRMDRLIEELLAFGRLSNTDLPRRGVDMDMAFRSAIMQFSSEAKEKGAKIDVRSPLPGVWANPTIVEQIAANLIGNALKFVRPGQAPVIVVRAETQGNVARIWVEDNGIGIEKAYHDKIFGLFERLHSDKQYRGTGIGLAIVRKGMERMGGRAGVESEVGKGSRFWFELPIKENV
jgi:PAS domain S-box-containing protein